MKTISSTLKPHIERWDDPGPARCNAGSALPSRWFVEYIEGAVVVELTESEMRDALDGADTETTAKQLREMVDDWINDNASEVEHDCAELDSCTWDVEDVDTTHNLITLSVGDKFECEPSGPPERDGDAEYDLRNDR